MQYRISIGVFYHNCHSMPMKKMLIYVKSCSLFDTFLKYLLNIIQVSSVVCYKFVFKEFCKNITFTLILWMIILLGNDVHENQWPFNNGFSIFLLNIRSIRHKYRLCWIISTWLDIVLVGGVLVKFNPSKIYGYFISANHNSNSKKI